MHEEVQRYIVSVNANEPNLTRIELKGLKLTDTDIAPLMESFRSNSAAARKITAISFDDNKLTGASTLDFRIFTQLEELSLQMNSITVPPIVAGLGNLKSLAMHGNRLLTIPDLTGLNSISYLSLSNNPLTYTTRCILNRIREARDHRGILNGLRADRDYLEVRHDGPHDTQNLTYDMVCTHIEELFKGHYAAYDMREDLLLVKSLRRDVIPKINNRSECSNLLAECEKVIANIDKRLQFDALLKNLRQYVMFSDKSNEVMQYIEKHLKSMCLLDSDQSLLDRCFQRDVITRIKDSIFETLRYQFSILKNKIIDYGAESLQEIYTIISDDQKFYFMLLQELLHDIYLDCSNEREHPDMHIIKRLVEEVLNLIANNPDFELGLVKNLMYSTSGFKMESTPLTKVVKEVEENPFLLNNYLSFILKENLPLKSNVPLTWNRALYSLRSRDTTFIEPAGDEKPDKIAVRYKITQC